MMCAKGRLPVDVAADKSARLAAAMGANGRGLAGTFTIRP
jgi:hypothetical protein